MRDRINRPAYVEMRTALNALYLAVEASVADDIEKHVLAAIDEAEEAAKVLPQPVPAIPQKKLGEKR